MSLCLVVPKALLKPGDWRSEVKDIGPSRIVPEIPGHGSNGQRRPTCFNGAWNEKRTARRLADLWYRNSTL